MPGPLDILKNVLELEKSKAYRDSSVSGGMEKFTAFMDKPDIQAILDADDILVLKGFFSSYGSLNNEKRAESIEQILSFLEHKDANSHLNSSLAFQEKKQPDSGEKNLSGLLKGQDPALYANIKSLRGIGERNFKVFKKLGVTRVIDLLRYFPRRYQDFSNLKSIEHVRYGDELSIIGSISQDVFIRDSRSGKMQIIETAISDGTGTLRLNWFNKPFLRNQLHKGMPIVVSGKVGSYLGRLVMSSPEWEPLDSGQLHTNRIVPIYPLTSGISQRQMRTLIGSNLKVWAKKIKEYFDQTVLSVEELMTIDEAIRQIHFPDSEALLNQAKTRFAFEEIFFLQLGVLIQKRNWVEAAARRFAISVKESQAIQTSLPYILTQAQQSAIKDILKDLSAGKPMNRLLQGDVGSGKTIVARFAIEAITRNGSQAAVMAPTSILAEQHFKTLTDLSSRSNSLDGDEIALLIGDTPNRMRESILTDLATGKIKLIIGTHALLEEPVAFNDLQLAVIDEQHRFGVEQRKTLRVKGDSPHLLVMTATPIPRSLAMTIYGDMDVSIIDEMPTGRLPVQTNLLHPDEREKAYGMIRDQVNKGFQAFIIYPMVESENEGEDFTAAINEHARLSKNIFADLKIGLIHGKLKQADKDRIMNHFRDGKFDILVSTTVIEVGVDIPNASVVLIEGANHFGLAQLHQIRGRVGRNSEKSYCILIPDREDGLENERLSSLVRSNDGFELADIDLKLRGPGEFLGTRQSGYLAMRYANLTDIRSIERCRMIVKRIFEADPLLQKDENRLLAEELMNHWPEINLN